ncbi:MAG TPA: hypothetical protein VK665_09815 [Candidatus Elarobacter sp.]|nr:hypothetical protein [Candidatus Elarobacter sp.]
MTTLESKHHAKHNGEDTPAPLQLWPMDATITGIRVDLGGTGTPGGSGQIMHYFGYPFYYHVAKSTAGTGVDITIDENSPSSYDPTITSTHSLPVDSVTLTYTYYTPPPNPTAVSATMTYDSPGGQYAGGPLNLCMEFSDDLSSATLVVEPRPAPQQDDETRLGIVVVNKAYTSSGSTRGYFVRVPIAADSSGNLPTTTTIHWPGSGGMAGPVGGGQVP